MRAYALIQSKTLLTLQNCTAFVHPCQETLRITYL